MLNDLRTIERGLAANGIDLVPRHSDIKDMAKGRAFRVRLDMHGQITGINVIADAGRGTVWTLRDAQHNGFPGLKTAAGLLSLDHAARKAHEQAWDQDKSPNRRREELLRLLTTYPVNAEQISDWPSAGHRKRIGERLEALRSLSNDPMAAAVPATFERFLAALKATPSFLESLTTVLGDFVTNRGDDWLEPVRAALIEPAALVIDAAESDFPRDASDPRQVGPVSDVLSKRSGDDAGRPEDGRRCAFTGNPTKLHTGNFPQPNLPGLGQSYIFSRNKDIPSLTRYGHTADASFPIDADLVLRLAGAIAALTGEDAKGKNWRLIPAETGDQRDLLVISAADPRARFADAVAGDSADNDDDVANPESALAQMRANVIQHSHGEYEVDTSDDTVVILVLRTVDPANRKTIYHRSTTAAAFKEAARRWQSATGNTPNWLTLPIPVKGQRELAVRKPVNVTPISIIRASKVQFANGGRRRIPVIGVTAAEAFGLFLHEGNVEQRARKMLRLLLQRHRALLSGLAAARFKGIEHLKDFDPRTDLRQDALRSVAWIGTLLHHLDRLSTRNPDMPEGIPYTDDVAFRLGQFLSAADLIHVGYCADLRGGDVPPTLLGNSVLAIAGSDPIRALSILQTRLKPYLAWAKRTDIIFTKAAAADQQGNKGRAIALRQGVGQARRADEIASDVRAMLGPFKTKDRKPDEAFKAELLLGYMAGFPPTKKSQPVGSKSTEADLNNSGKHGDQS